jgi:hypothetical protein
MPIGHTLNRLYSIAQPNPIEKHNCFILCGMVPAWSGSNPSLSKKKGLQKCKPFFFSSGTLLGTLSTTHVIAAVRKGCKVKSAESKLFGSKTIGRRE